jgi:hypothetical protein
MEVREYSAADGWREITDRLPPMIEEGVEFNVAAAALKRFLDDRPGYTGVYAGEAGRSHWKRAAGKPSATTGSTQRTRTSSAGRTVCLTRSGAPWT